MAADAVNKSTALATLYPFRIKYTAKKDAIPAKICTPATRYRLFSTSKFIVLPSHFPNQIGIYFFIFLSSVIAENIRILTVTTIIPESAAPVVSMAPMPSSKMIDMFIIPAAAENTSARTQNINCSFIVLIFLLRKFTFLIIVCLF